MLLQNNFQPGNEVRYLLNIQTTLLDKVTQHSLHWFSHVYRKHAE